MRSHPQEDGAALLFVAMTMLLLLGIAALVVDIAGLQLDMRSDRLASDFGARAGAAALDPFNSSSAPEDACNTAAAYVLANLDETSWASTPACSSMPPSCNDSTAATTVSGDVGPYHVEITYPVPPDSSLMNGQPLNADEDGTLCSRIGVSIRRDHDYTFARVLGFNQGSTTIRSVAKNSAGPGLGELVPLVLLEPHDCEALYTTGQGKVTVESYQDTPGLIVVDSDASPQQCGSQDPYSIDSQGELLGWIRALPVKASGSDPEIPSAIFSYALSQSAASAANSFDPADVLKSTGDPGDGSDSGTWFRLYPEPTGIRTRVTRAPIDYRYNCNYTYDPYFDLPPLPPCPEAAEGTAEGTNDHAGDYIDQLVQGYGGTGLPGNGAALFHKWTDPLPSDDPNYLNYPDGFPCDLQGSDDDIEVSGNWYVDCPGTTGGKGFTVRNSVTFSSGDVVFDGQVRTVSGGSIRINNGGSTNPTENHIAYVRAGDLIKDAQSAISLEYTMVYLADGRVDFNGGSGGLVWSAPDIPLGTQDDCPITLQDCFDDLALWAESSQSFYIGGQAINGLEGTFFTPEADPFELHGQGGQYQTKAQFITRKLLVSGQGKVRMEPNPDRFTPIPLREITLIR